MKQKTLIPLSLVVFLFSLHTIGQNLADSVKIVLHTSDGALVGIDGRMSTTNYMRPYAVLGSHVVTVIFGESFKKEYSIMVTKTETSFDFPIEGKLQVSSIPTDGKVFVDGVEQGLIPQKLPMLGKHNIRVRGDYGYYYDYTTCVDINPLEEKSLEVVLKKRPPRTYGMVLLNFAPGEIRGAGLTLAIVKRWGVYARFMVDTHELGSISNGFEKPRTQFYGNNGPGFYNDPSVAFKSFSFGPIIRCTKFLYAFAGAGYGSYTKELNPRMTPSPMHDWFTPYGSEGALVDAGVILKWKALLLQGGYQMILGKNNPEPYKGFYLGLGITIHKQRKEKL